MFRVALDGVVEELILATISDFRDFGEVQSEDLKQKLFLMILENAVAAGFVSHTVDRNLRVDVFVSNPSLAENWSRLVASPMKANVADISIHALSGSRRRVLGSNWPSKEARVYVDAFFDGK